jgi:hypothetical protein
MRRQIRSIPDEFPNARLFIDDIETIVQILSQAMEKTATSGTLSKKIIGGTLPDKNEVKVVYSVDNDEMDSIDDLLERGGSLTKLEIRVGHTGAYGSVAMKFGGMISRPRVSLYGLSADEQWTVYGKIRDVLQRRRMILKNFIDDLPLSVTIGSWVVVSQVPWIMDSIPKIHRGPIYNAVGIAYFVLAVPWIICFLIWMFGSSRIYLARYHERSRASAESRRRYAMGVITFLLGVVATKIIDHFIPMLFK